MQWVMDPVNKQGITAAKEGDIMLVRMFDYTPDPGADLDEEGSYMDCVYYVKQILYNFSGEPKNMIVQMLHYRLDESEMTFPSFQIFGGEIVAKGLQLPDLCWGLVNFNEHIRLHEAVFVSCIVSPSVESVRLHCMEDYEPPCCLAGCEQGWLRNPEHLLRVMKDAYVTDLGNFKPLCPVCYGREIVKRQTGLRIVMSTGHTPSPPLRHGFRLLVNRRREQLGYDGLCDCDLCLLPSSEHHHPRSHEEAVRLAEIQLFHETRSVEEHPTSEEAIAALPVKVYAETKSVETKCTVCQDDFHASSQVAVLPCAHIICATGCTDWLRHQASCPVCRHALPCAPKKAEKSTEDGPVEGGSWDADGEGSDALTESFASVSLETGAPRDMEGRRFEVEWVFEAIDEYDDDESEHMRRPRGMSVGYSDDGELD